MIAIPVRSADALSAIRKARRRILPFLFLLYIVAFLDRVNVAFAKSEMSKDLGLSETQFGFGAGIFFLGYLIFEIPGALIVERWSARKWIARILITWGACTVLIGFVRNPTEFYSARLLLGAAEAGFFPGLIVYLSHWFPEAERSRALAGLILAVPVSQVVGAPISGLLLNLDILGLAGWRWMFILEGLPAICLGFVTLLWLTDKPHQAKWLTPEERRALTTLIAEEATRGGVVNHSIKAALLTAFRNKNLLRIALALALANVGTYAFQLWLPTLMRTRVGLVGPWTYIGAALPFCAACAGLLAIGRSSDRHAERRWHTTLPLWLSGVFFVAAITLGNRQGAVFAALVLTGMFAYSWPPAFWSIPSLFLQASAAAAAVGFINSVGNIGGFFGPYAIGILLDSGGNLEWVSLFVLLCYLTAGAIILSVPRQGLTTGRPN